MGEALKEAQKAFNRGEVPVGCVAVLNDKIIVRSHNMRETASDPTAHAEVIALRKASGKMRSWRLNHVLFYVTVEPCIMCMGALIQARVSKLVFGSYDPKGGAAGSLYSLHNDSRLNHRIEVISGIKERESGELLHSFFRALRGQKKIDMQFSSEPCGVRLYYKV
jgi:tRNA(adenine34) deaminase